MKKLVYSPEALEKLNLIREDVKFKYGTDKAKEVISKITRECRDLQKFENKAPAVESLLGIPCDYRMMYILHNYVFYRVEESVVRIVDIYNEKEDFMWNLFGIRTTTQETEDYWNE